MALPLQALAAENDPGAWLIFSTSGAFRIRGEDSRWRYWFDAQARYFDLGTGINQWLARPAIGYKLGKDVNGWIGYARFRSRNRAGQVADENRYWQQIDWLAGYWNEGRITMQIRTEQRSVSTGDDVGFVVRFLTTLVTPIGRSKRTNLIAGLEPFFDLRDTDWGGESGLSQNRLFVSLGRKLNDKISIEAGYMNQYLWIDNAENQSNHLAVLHLKARF